MKKFRDLTLRGKIVLMTTTISALVLISTCVVFGIYEAYSFRQSLVNSVAAKADIVGLHSVVPLLFGDDAAATETLSTLKQDANVIAGALYKADGELFAAYTSSAAVERGITLPRAPYQGQHFGDSIFELCQPIVSENETIGAVYLCTDLAWHYARLWRYAGMAAIVFLVMLLVTLGLSVWAQSILTDPIEKMMRVARSITHGETDYSVRVPGEERQDELGELVHAFNLMLDRIENTDIELHAAQEHLEQRVESRTNELIEEIKQRRRTEADLRIARDKAQKYLDMAGVMLVALDAECNVTLLNQKGQEVTGYSEDELLGRNWLDTMVPKDEHHAVMQIFRDVFAGKNETSTAYVEKPILTRDGQRREIAWRNVRLVGPDGDIIGTLSAGMDITEQQKAEAELRRAQKLESIGTFAGGIAHDFNNFLMVIHGNIELARMSLDASDDTHQLLEDATQAAQRARGLTRQLITFSKGGQPQKRIVQIEKLVRDTVTFVLTGAHVSADFNVPEGLWLTHVDTGQIEQVLTNLVLNAKQAMPTGGAIHIALANVPPTAAIAKGLNRNAYVELTIRDEGTGIPEDVLQRVFDPYFTTKQEGSGLGLATSYSIITKHGGHISVESKAGEGATFHIWLPALTETDLKDQVAPGKSELSRSYNVLLMEDEPMVATVIDVMLGRLKCQSSWAVDGEEALRLYKEARAAGTPFDVVILDIIVPNGMGGKEASQKLLEIDPDAKLIVSSAYSNDPIMADYAAHGFQACLTKPYDHHDLKRTLKAVLEDNSATPATEQVQS